MNHTSPYLSEVAQYYADPNSSEHSYRTAFQNYLATIFPADQGYFIQQDAKAIDGNKPDHIILRNQVPLLYIEVKKVGEDLDKIEKGSQADRYFGYTNLIISDYVEFRFFRNGQRYNEAIKLADIHKSTRTLSVHSDRGDHLARTITDFVSEQKEPITRASHLAKIMGGKAQRIRDNVIALLASDSDRKADLEKMQRFIKDHLIAEFTTTDFADMYAQTLVYGLFAARYNDTTLDDFSRQEARSLIPATNPFLQSFFDHISGPSFPRRLEIIVDEFCVVFSHANVRTLMEEYFKQMTLDGGAKESPDPVIHFYEDFLREYNPKKKMEMGVFYTPLPVVRFIIRGLDDLLKREFGIHDGLADTATVDQVISHQNDKGNVVQETRTLHRVQVLDVAVGTGTFLNETIRFIHEAKQSQQGRWGAYVNDYLLPRLHGFELMMASYTIAHLKLAMTLGQTGVQNFDKRIGVYLSNTLDTPHDQKLQGDLFGVVDSIARESQLASEVKTDRPIMVVLGNPPYSGISQNKHYTDNDVYKVEPGGKEKLQERKHWLDDDYVKFIRFAESMIEKNGEGVIGMITAHGYLDNPTFRGMRWHLRNTFDRIYVVDLHGSTRNQNNHEVDENVFDIMTGTAIIFAVKKRNDIKTKTKVYRADIYGKRSAKFQLLDKTLTLKDINWSEISTTDSTWSQKKDGWENYQKGVCLSNLFQKVSMGFATARDKTTIQFSKKDIEKIFDDFSTETEEKIRDKYALGKDSRDWQVKTAIRDIKKSSDENLILVDYRPFDFRWTCYTGNSKGFYASPQPNINYHLRKNNIALNITKRDRDILPKVFCLRDRQINLISLLRTTVMYYPSTSTPTPVSEWRIWMRRWCEVSRASSARRRPRISSTMSTPFYTRRHTAPSTRSF